MQHDADGHPAEPLTLERRADRIFSELLDTEEPLRQSRLKELCGSDVRLAVKVEALLRFSAPRFGPAIEPGGGLHAIAHAIAPDDAPAAEGDTVGRYRIVRELGRGGMSIVYLAEQLPDSGHLVALKRLVLLPDDHLLARFRREARILGMLRHPDIAGLIEAGADDDQRPFIALEYVEGQPIDEYCDARRLAPRERLRLVVRMASAVAHAHAHLVIHRDIKPRNILVDGAGHPKLLDFGIATLSEDVRHQVTGTAPAPLTPAFASPEQLLGEPATTASDVYQLGLLLHVLLAGRNPRGRAAAAGFDATRSEPEPPSRFLARLPAGEIDEAARNRGFAHGRALMAHLAGDLDLIVCRATALDPLRRYASVRHLIDDIEAYLGGRPISARADSFTYRAGKYISRNRSSSALAAGLVLSIVAGLLVSLRQSHELKQALQQARSEVQATQEVVAFVTQTLRLGDPEQAPFASVTVVDAIASASRAVEERFEGRPDVEARVREVIGEVQEGLGQYEQAELHYRRILDLAETAMSGSARDAARVTGHRLLGRIAYRKDRHEEAKAHFEWLLAQMPSLVDDRTRLNAKSNLAGVLAALGEKRAAIRMSAQALDLRFELDGADHADTIKAQNNHASVLQATEPAIYPTALTEALFHAQQAADKSERVLGAMHPGSLLSRALQGKILSMLGRHEESIALFEQLLPRFDVALPPEHVHLTNAHKLYGAALASAGRVAEAEAVFARTVAAFSASRGDGHGDTLFARMNHADVLARLGRTEESRLQLARALSDGLDPQLAKQREPLAPILRALAAQ